MSEAPVRGNGVPRREQILDTAARLATVEGIDGLSIGRLAQATGMSKSGLYAHFGSKQELQLATIGTARQIFVDVVARPAFDAPAGIERLQAACERFLDHVERRVFPGGCFFSSVAAEVSGRPGPVRERIAREQLDWIALLKALADDARDQGQLTADTDTGQLAFELNAVIVAANTSFALHGDPSGLERARHAVNQRLNDAATPPTPEPGDPTREVAP